uniref:Nuclear nucleic acid-binding protein C1D n=1 Tax=Meloidogyne incognita TaxID=6306 RepID=A0A914NTD6_MELIC
MQQIPEDVIKKLSDFDKALTSFEDALDNHLNLQSQQNEQTSNLDKAKFELATLFAVNSLYWTYLHCKGKDPSQNSELAVELIRTKEYISKLKQYEDLNKRPKYDGKTVGRFVKHALFNLNEDSQTSKSDQFCQSSIKKQKNNSSFANCEITISDNEEGDDDIEVIEDKEEGELEEEIPIKKIKKI